MKALLLLVVLFTSSLALAGLYECKSPDGEPTLIEKNSKKVSFTTTPPFITPYAKDPRMNQESRKPFLIYYAVDSEEPFMQMSVRYELAELQKACERSEHVNFIVFLNSDITWKRFQYCKNKVLKEGRISEYPALDKKFEAKRKAIWEGDQSSNVDSPLKFVARYSDDVKRIFYDYPLAHPDFLYDLVEFAITTSELFPTEKYTPFINLKSHGNIKNLLSGLQKCQITSKTRSQDTVIKDVLSKDEQYFVKEKNYPFLIKQLRPILERIGLGASIGVRKDESLGEYSLGEYSLGEYSLGEYSLGDVFSGLGASEGLNAKFSFGTSQSGLSTVLNRLFNEQNGKYVGFVMLESCDTNRKVDIHQQHLPFVLGMYSAKHSLWYRNLNWWTLLEKAEGSSIKLVELLEKDTAQIKNIVVE